MTALITALLIGHLLCETWHDGIFNFSSTWIEASMEMCIALCLLMIRNDKVVVAFAAPRPRAHGKSSRRIRERGLYRNTAAMEIPATGETERGGGEKRARVWEPRGSEFIFVHYTHVQRYNKDSLVSGDACQVYTKRRDSGTRCCIYHLAMLRLALLLFWLWRRARAKITLDLLHIILPFCIDLNSARWTFECPFISLKTHKSIDYEYSTHGCKCALWFFETFCPLDICTD